MKRIVLFIAALLALAFAPSALAEQARSAKALTDSAGVNTHLGYSNTVYYQNWPMIRDRLRELGVSHLRDGTFPANYPDVIGPTVAARYRELGLGLNLLVGEEQGPISQLSQRLGWIKREGLTGQIIGLEGENESRRDSSSIRADQCTIWNAVKSDAELSSKLVIGPSAGDGGDGGDDFNWYQRVGDLSGCLERGNLHPYPGEDPPHMRLGWPFQTALDWGRTTYGQHAYWVTENGYWNKSPNGSHISERAAGVYTPRMLLDHFRHGVLRTQLYELIDLNSASDQVIENYGLLRTDGAAKPAFTALSNLLAITKDTVEASGDLGFSITCTSDCRTDDPVRHVLLARSDGTYDVAFWSESEVWDGNADTPEAPQNIDFTFDNAPGKIELYEPNTGRTPIGTNSGGSKTLSTTAVDQVRILRVTPGAAHEI